MTSFADDNTDIFFPPWRIWAARLLGGLGTSLFLAGVICFFAYNWVRLVPWLRFSLVEGLFVLSALGAMATASARTSFHALSAAAALTLIGVFWAVFGQLYQTGADAWQLFALWAACGLPWLVLVPRTALWLVWLLVANIALALWNVQSLSPSGTIRHIGTKVAWDMVLLNGTALLCCLGWLWRSHRKAGGWPIAPMVPLVGAAAFIVCGNILLFPEARLSEFSQQAFLQPRTVGAGLTLLVLLGGGLRLRYLPAVYLVAFGGFAVLNCLLFIWMPDELVAIFLLFLVGNMAYALLLAFRLPRPADASSPQRLLPAGIGHNILMGVAAFLCALFLGLLFVATFHYGSTSLLVPGLLFLGASIFLEKRGPAQSPFVRHLSLALGLAGLGFATEGTLFGLDLPAAWMFALVTAAVYVFHPSAIIRFLGVIVALFLFLADFSFYEDIRLMYPITAGLFLLCALPLFYSSRPSPSALEEGRSDEPKDGTADSSPGGLPDRPQAGRRLSALLRPGAWAALLFLAVTLTSWSPALEYWNRHAYRYGGWDGIPDPDLFWHGFSYILWLGLLAHFALMRYRETKNRNFLAPLPLLAVIGWLAPPALLYGVFLLALGRQLRVRLLEMTGIVVVLVNLSIWYYQMDVTLMQKGLRLMGAGVLLALCAMPLSRKDRPRLPRRGSFHLRTGPRTLLLAVLTLACLGLFQWAIWDKEQLLARGREVLLALAPVDPRSLIQGDYMALEYEIEDRVSWRETQDHRHGFIIVSLEPEFGQAETPERMVGRRFVFRTEPDPLMDNEIAIPARPRGYSGLDLRLPSSFLFQEGHAEAYEEAAFAVLRCTAASGCLLTGLADAQGRDIRPETHSPENQRGN